MGTTAQLTGKEKIGEREAYVLTFEPTSGSPVRQYIDAETYLLMRIVMKVHVPQIDREVELTTDFGDYREVDGVKLAFRLTTTSAIQNYTIVVDKVEHNVRIDEALFSKPVTP
jgi:hypothetical protein